MNSNEAYELLGLQNGAAEDEIKAAFRKQAARLHPDVNKSPTAEDDFKKLNEAYQLLTKPQPAAQTWDIGNKIRWTTTVNGFNKVEFSTIHDLFERVYGAKPAATLTISFEESVLGCEKEIKINSNNICSYCLGKTYIQKSTEILCKKCDGKGYRQYQGNDKQLPCTTCRGSGKEYELIGCDVCKGTGKTVGFNAITVKIGAGISDGETISVNGVGLRINVIPHASLVKSGLNIISTIKIPLIDALKGTVKEVETVVGMKSLKIKGPRKNMDQVVAAGLGVPPYGNHIFILNVEYPENIDSLVKALEEASSN